ncbi:MAG: GNAT family N-acetyltransferase, partial [Anaerolineae bacterium]|nr:GNAT family N-acetyltransferase [Anaerolineae bacterium]
MIAREKLTARPCQPSDYPALVALINAARRAVGDERMVTIGDLRQDFESPGFDITENTILLEAQRRMIGFGELDFDPGVRVFWTDGYIHPDYWGQGIGTELLRLTEARAREWLDRENLPPDQPVAIQRHTIDVNPAAIHLFEAEGYQHVRTFHQMRVALDQPIDPPPLPPGIVLRPFEPERDAHAVYETHMDTFADHWGFEHLPYENWTHAILNRPNNDYGLWLVAWAGDEIAGICLNRPYGAQEPESGWVWELGVRRRWHKQGLGAALLRHSLARLRLHGYKCAGLSVDSASPTNAVALYER